MPSSRRRSVVLFAFIGALAACGGTAATPGTIAPMPPIAFDELAALPAPDADGRIAYGAEPDQFGELRLPQGNGSAPVVVLIHGGCWLQAYDVAHTRPLAAALATAGYAVWSPEYRRVGGAGGVPETLLDVGAAVDSVRLLARRFPRLDTTRTVLVGHSAGGHLALVTAGRGRSDGIRTNVPGHVTRPLVPTGVVSLAGITDLTAYAAGTGSCNRAVAPLLGGRPPGPGSLHEALSPARHPPPVPMRIVHGAADPIVPLAQSEALVRAAPERTTLVVVPDAGHFDVVAPRGPAFDALLAAIAGLVAR